MLQFLLLIIPLTGREEEKSNLPISREAVIIEYTSPSEIMIKATGYGISRCRLWTKSKDLDKKANIDARKAALWHLLFGETNPILKTQAEIEKFKKIENKFFQTDNINQFITWESTTYEQRVKLENGRKLKIVKTFRVNIKLLKDFLSSNGIIEPEKAILEKVGLPQIMVMPETGDSIIAVDLLKQDPLLKKGAEAIEQSLTARGFEAVAPEQISTITDMLLSHLSMVGETPDPAYIFALSTGSDIYITFNLSYSSRLIGSTPVKKYVATCRAFETTTGRLLGTEIGYSKESPSHDTALIEEAINNAIGKVLDRIIDYWKKDIERGIQYRVIISIDDKFNKKRKEKILYSIRQTLREIGEIKENSISDSFCDLMIWVDRNNFPGAFDVYMNLGKKLHLEDSSIEKLFINRKLMVLKVKGI